MFRKFFLLSLKNISHRSLRSWLTILGIIVGIALIASLISLGKGLENAIMQQLRMFGSDLITIIPGEETDPMLGMIGGGTFRDKEVDALKDIKGAKFAIPFEIEFSSIEFKGEERSSTIHGSPMKETQEIYTQSRGFGLAEGRWPHREDSSEVVLGATIANKRYKQKIYVGDTIRVKGKRFKVVGVLEELGSSEDDNAVYMSLKNLRVITGKKGSVRMILVTLREGYTPNMIAEDIKYKLKRERGSADFTVITPDKAEQIVGGVLGTIQLAVVFIAFFSIFVGGIGVMNTMYTSVLERRREIGIMKAIGATRSNIWTIFVIESGMIGLLGGIIGLLIGLGLAKGAEIAAIKSGFKYLTIYAGIEFILGILAFAFLLGVLSGFLPARQASKLPPAEALRYE